MRDSRAIRYSLAILLLFVATLSGASACALNLCKAECPMHQPVGLVERHGCCDEQVPKKSPEPKCVCIIKATLVVNKAPQPPVVAAPALGVLAITPVLPLDILGTDEVQAPVWHVLTHLPTGPPPDEHGSRAPPL